MWNTQQGLHQFADCQESHLQTLEIQTASGAPGGIYPLCTLQHPRKVRLPRFLELWFIFTFLLPLWGELAGVALHGHLVAVTCTTSTGKWSYCPQLESSLDRHRIMSWPHWPKGPLAWEAPNACRYTTEQSFLHDSFFLVKLFPKWERKIEKQEAGNQVSKTEASRPKQESWQAWMRHQEWPTVTPRLTGQGLWDLWISWAPGYWYMYSHTPT